MHIFRFFLLIVSLVAVSTTYAHTGSEKFAVSFFKEKDSLQQLSLAEWKKFKNFEKRLHLDTLSETNKDVRLMAYSRDSIQILGVKLLAVKLLNDKKLLDRDIAENSTYYEQLLIELRKSNIPQIEYRFLEEKMALLNQRPLEKKLAQSRWLNYGLIVTSLGLLVTVLFLQKRRKNSVPIELSRQEHTVRSLILQGKTNKEIADELFISLSTVKSHITNIYSKLQVSGRRELLQKHTGTST